MNMADDVDSDKSSDTQRDAEEDNNGEVEVEPRGVQKKESDLNPLSGNSVLPLPFNPQSE